MDIKAAVFDIDGTLYPNYKMFLFSISSFIPHPRLVYHFGKVRGEIRSLDYTDDFRSIQAEMVGKSMGISRDRAFRMIEKYLYHKWENSFRYLKPFPSVIPVIKELRESGIKIGILSDFPVRKKTGFLGIDDLTDYALCSEDTGYLKPHPAPFLHISKELEIKPEKILFVGNSYKYDVIGSVSVGMKAAHFSKSVVEDSKADFTFSDYFKLRDFILK